MPSCRMPKYLHSLANRIKYMLYVWVWMMAISPILCFIGCKSCKIKLRKKVSIWFRYQVNWLSNWLWIIDWKSTKPPSTGTRRHGIHVPLDLNKCRKFQLLFIGHVRPFNMINSTKLISICRYTKILHHLIVIIIFMMGACGFLGNLYYIYEPNTCSFV